MISAGFGVCGPVYSCVPVTTTTTQTPIPPPPTPTSSTELIHPTTNTFKSPISVTPYLSGYEISYADDQSNNPVVDCVPLVYSEEIISTVAEEVVKCEEVMPHSNNTNFSIQVAACDLCGVPLASLPTIGASGVFCSVCMRKCPVNLETNYSEEDDEEREQMTCEICAQYFPDPIELIKHKETHIQLNGSSSFLCKVCFLCFQSEGQLMDHMKMHDQVEQPFACKMCPATFPTTSECAKHAASHHHTLVPEMKSGSEPVVCSLCNMEFTSEVELQQHFDRHHEELDDQDSLLDPLSGFCVGFNDDKEESTKKTKRKSSNAENKQLFKYRCDFCSEQFPDLKKLNSHRRLHTGEKPFICPVCCKAFRENIYLKRHMYLHTKARDHVCNFCGKAFQFRNHLVEHQRIHTGERPFKCEFCSMRFTQTSVLMRHQVIHTGERLHACHICTKKFSRRNQLEVHLRTHSGEKPFQCKFCFKTFNQSGQLTRHTRRHQLGGKPIVKSSTLLPSDILNSATMDSAPAWDFYLPQIVLADSPADITLDVASL